MGHASGVETTYAITEVMPLVRVAVLTTDQDQRDKTVAAVRAGALGELDKVDALEEAARVIRSVHGGWPVLTPATWAGVAAEVPAWLGPSDTVGEQEGLVLLALADGADWAAAAAVAGTGAEAARNQVRNLLSRGRAGGYPDAARAALGAGLVGA